MIPTKVKSWARSIALIILPALVFGCGESNNQPPPTLLSILVTPMNPSIAPGTPVQLAAVGTFSDNLARDITSSVTWGSSNTTVATVSALGLATSTLTAGSTTITASSGNVNGSTTLTTSPVASIAVKPPTPPSIAPGTTQQYVATATLANGAVQAVTSFATWGSSNTAIATMSNAQGSKGLGTAVTAPGSATITANYGGINGTAALTSSALASIAVSPASASIAK